MPTLSVIIISKNEAQDIRDCLESIKWANEIIVLDSGSTDETVAICKEYTHNVFVTDWPGYGPQKNRALQRATSDWVLSLDADERVTSQLKQEILASLPQKKYSAFAIPRHSAYCGQFIEHGAWRKKPVIRLFQRTRGHFDDAIVHENIIIEGNIGKLKTPLLHYTYRNLEEMLEKMNAYSTARALQKHHAGEKGGLVSAIFHGFWAFFRSYILQLGFLDGKFGFILAVSNAEYAYYCYLKLLLLSKKNCTP